MAGIGFELKRIFTKEGFLTTLKGIGYSSMVTVGPTLVVIATILILYRCLNYTGEAYGERELLSSIILYNFVFSLIVTAPVNAVVSRYIADLIFEERMEEILPSFYTGMALTSGIAAALAVPFCLRMYFVGQIDVLTVFSSYVLFVMLVMVFFTMIYLSATKDFKIIAAMFLMGMAVAAAAAALLHFLGDVRATRAILFGMTIGIFSIAAGEFAYVRRYFRTNNGNYGGVLRYFLIYKKLFFANLFYILGLYVHNFMFWTSPLRVTAADTFISAPVYDLATCIAMFTSISTMVLFIVEVETSFHDCYQIYFEKVIGATLKDIQRSRNEMFRLLSNQINFLVEVQAIITCTIYLLAMVFLPRMGFGGMTLTIYPSLAAAYFVIFIMYCNTIFLYYFDDMDGALLTGLLFLLGSAAGTLWSMRLSAEFYGAGVFLGGLLGWAFSYFRLRYIEKTFDGHIFCRGQILEERRDRMPSGVVYEKGKGKII